MTDVAGDLGSVESVRRRPGMYLGSTGDRLDSVESVRRRPGTYVGSTGDRGVDFTTG